MISAPRYSFKEGLFFAPPYRKYTFLVTDDCNLECQYCYEKYKAPNSMSWEVARKFIDQIFAKDIHTHRFPETTFGFCGGETLLKADLIDQCITYIKEKIAEGGGEQNFKPIRYKLVTNGTLFGDAKVRKLFENHRIECGVSIDGLPATHNKLRCNSYDRIAPQVEWWKSTQDGRATAMVTVSSENVSDLAKGIRHLVEDLGIYNLSISIVFDDENWRLDQYTEIFYAQLIEIANLMLQSEYFSKVWCNAFDIGSFMPVHDRYPACPSTKTGLSVDYTGKLYVCFRFKNPEMRRDFSVGDVDSWIDESKMAVFQNCTTSNIQGFEECATCDIGSGCKRCPALNAEKNGGLYCGTINLCKVHHARFFATQYLIKRREEIWRQVHK
jgi:radical SAM protein with 4Fe4S-binding SPASM domain